MYLIDCSTHEVVETVTPETFKYAILSHTWDGDQEVTFEEFRAGSAKDKRGWDKIHMTIELAREDGCNFLWVDTCLIDKKSSAELEEAINSMFSWYRKSRICYVYLSDHDSSNPDDLEHRDFTECNYWTRGWTLQELLAPAEVRFYDRTWRAFGTRDSLSRQISAITNIPMELLLSSARKKKEITEYLIELPVAVRMGWAANRVTKRPEDIAYCLLGIFQVNIRMIYGEGAERAFYRLQEEIMRNGNDLSILAWIAFLRKTTRYSGVFASHPKAFKVWSGASKLKLDSDRKYFPEVTMTTKGLKLETQMGFNSGLQLHYINLHCHTEVSNVPIGIYLKHQGASFFARARPEELLSGATIDFDNREIYLDTKLISSEAHDSELDEVHRGAFCLTPLEDTSDWFMSAAKPESLWDDAQSMFITAGCKSFVGYVEFTNISRGAGIDSKRLLKKFFIAFGYEEGEEPWASIYLAPAYHFDRQVARGNWLFVATMARRDRNKYTPHRVFTERDSVARVGVTLDQVLFRGQTVTHVNWFVEGQ